MRTLLFLAVAAVAAAWPRPIAAQAFSRCITFEDLTNGTRYGVGDSFSSAGVTITVSSTWADTYAEVDDQQAGGGSGLEIRPGNVTLQFGLGGPVDGLSLLFGEYGGDNHLEVNGDFESFGRFNELNGSSVGGVTLAVIGGAGNDTGTLTLIGTISSFAIGGQELWIDNVCPGGQTAATNEHEVSLFLGGLHTDEKLPLNAGLNTGFRWGYNFYQTFWLELETGLTFTNEAETDGLLRHAQLHLRWHPVSPTRPVDPFLLVGGGVADYNTIGSIERSPVIVWGLGLEFYWLDNVGFRLDVGDLWLTDMLGVSTHNFWVRWGSVFWF